MNTVKQKQVREASACDNTSQAKVLAIALIKAGRYVALTQEDLAQIVGGSRSRLRDGIEPESKKGELALMFISLVDALGAVFGNDQDIMRHWMKTPNKHLQGTPKELAKTYHGLSKMLGYVQMLQDRI